MSEFDKARKLAEKHQAQVAALSPEQRIAYAIYSEQTVIAEAPKPKRKYTRKAKAEKVEAKPKTAKGNGSELDLKFPKPGAKKRGRPRKVQTMVPPAEAPQIEAEA